MKVQVKTFSLVQKINDWRSSRLRGCDAGESAAEVLKASPAGWRQPRKGFFGEKMPSQKLNFGYFYLGGRGMNDKGFGEATL